MPFAGLGVTALSDVIGMKTSLAIAGVAYGAITLVVLARVRNQCGGLGTSEVDNAQNPPPMVATV
jgi:hypothetical protein